MGCSDEFRTANFGDIYYKDSQGRKQKAVAMTRDGFVFLAMGYRGKKAMRFKKAYIQLDRLTNSCFCAVGHLKTDIFYT